MVAVEKPAVTQLIARRRARSVSKIVATTACAVGGTEARATAPTRVTRSRIGKLGARPVATALTTTLRTPITSIRRWP